MNRQTYDLTAREIIWRQTKGHILVKLNWWHEGGNCFSAHYSFSSYTEGHILPPLQLFLLHRMSEVFGWCACAQPLNRACSRQGWSPAQISCCLSPCSSLWAFYVWHHTQSCPWHLHLHLPCHPWKCHLLSRLQCPCVHFSWCLTGENQSLPWNLAFCMQIIEISFLWSSSNEAYLWNRKQLGHNVNLCLCTERYVSEIRPKMDCIFCLGIRCNSDCLIIIIILPAKHLEWAAPVFEVHCSK